MTIITEHRRDRLQGPVRAVGNCSRARDVTRCFAIFAAVAVLAGVAVGELAGSGTTLRHSRPAAARIVAEAAAYRFPLGCLSATLSTRSFRPAGDATTRTGPCWHYGVYVTAVLRRVDGIWRLMLASRSDECRRTLLPAAIRALLVACEKSNIKAVRTMPRFAGG